MYLIIIVYPSIYILECKLSNTLLIKEIIIIIVIGSTKNFLRKLQYISSMDR